MLERRRMMAALAESFPSGYTPASYIYIANDTTFDNGILLENRWADVKKIVFSVEASVTGLSQQYGHFMLFASGVDSGTGVAAPFVCSFQGSDGISGTGFDSFSVSPKVRNDAMYGQGRKTFVLELSTRNTGKIIFGCWNDVNFSREAAWYGVKLYGVSGLIADLYPCMRERDGVPGYYDTIGKIFYQNKGSGKIYAAVQK